MFKKISPLRKIDHHRAAQTGLLQSFKQTRNVQTIDSKTNANKLLTLNDSNSYSHNLLYKINLRKVQKQKLS